MRRSGYRPKPVQVIRENGDIGALQGRNQDDYDIKVFQYRKQTSRIKTVMICCARMSDMTSLII